MRCLLLKNDPTLNLAIEEYLLLHAHEFGSSFLLYINSPCVVIGRYQNPWLECDMDLIAEQSIPLLRRISGGGTVYHDAGNLNYSFVMQKNEYDENKQFNVIRSALKSLGIETRIDEHKSIWIKDRKISGSAFARKLNAYLHHGTMLVNANLQNLSLLLQPSFSDATSRATKSRRVPVTNLALEEPALSMNSVIKALQNEVSGFGINSNFIALDNTEINTLQQKYISDTWTFPPQFAKPEIPM